MGKRLEILFTSDTHGHVFPVNYAGKRPEASGLLSLAAQEKKGPDSLMIDGGDSLQGTPLTQYYLAHREQYRVHPVAEAFNALECDYFTLGNHDFNFGYDVIRDYLRAMNGQCLCANVEDLRGELEMKPWEIRVMESGLRVGITGIVTDYVNVWEQPAHLSELRVTEPLSAAQKALAEMKDACDLTICVYHGGFEEDLETGALLSDTTENIACRIARELDFDLLLTGHQHMAVPGVMLSGTYAVQPPSNAVQYVKLELGYDNDPDGEETLAVSSELVKVGDGLLQKLGETFAARDGVCGCGKAPSDGESGAGNGEKALLPAALAAYQRLLFLEKDTQAWLDQVLGSFAEAIPAADKLSAALYGSQVAALFNQVQLGAAEADFSCTSLGNDPVGFAKDVTMRDVCGAYLFSNTLVMVEVDEAVLRESLERCASYFDLEDGKPVISERFLKPKIEHYNYDFYAGLTYTFDLRKPVGERVVELKKLDGTPLGDKKYRLITSDYRATGTGGYPALGRSRVLWRGTDEMPLMIAEYIRTHSPVGKIENTCFRVIW